MEVYIAYILTGLLILGLYVLFMYLREQDKKKIMTAMASSIPASRNMEVDLAWLNHLIEKECANVENMILIPRHRNKGGFCIVTDDIYKEAVIMTSKNVLMRMSETQFKILEFYAGDKDAVEGYIISRITEYLREKTDKLNSKVVNKMN